MRYKALILAAVIAATPLGGCAALDRLSGGRLDLLTVGITNPIGTDQQYEIEGAVTVARRAAVEYFRLPQCRKTQAATLEVPCAKRSIKVQIQQADQKLEIVLKAYRKFVKDNPTITPTGAITAVWDVLGQLRASINAAGVTN